MGFTKEQSSNALIINGTVEKAIASLSGLSGMIFIYVSLVFVCATVFHNEQF